METYVWLIPTLPLVAFLVTILVGRWYIKDSAHWLPIAAMAGSFGLSVKAWLDIRGAEEPFVMELWRWISVGKFQVPIGLQVDQLSAVMLLVVTGVGFLIFVYSKGYMHGDTCYYRFYAYLSLFAFSMLMLVLANNYLLLYLGWEAVGLCSYYLIGFFYHKKSAASAGKKAFIINRVGDFGFGLGVMLIFVTLGTLNYTEVFHSVEGGALSEGMAVAIALLLFMGAMGKSAQFPLHVWLPDAMEGPTPVSALIHAATMVNAGVYLVARTNPIFSHVPEAMVVVAAIGIFTAILAASIAFTQTDIKRVLAYSTLSQLGYMFAALGVGAYVAAIFHLMAHGFFKGLLFLGSGSVIHSVHDEQDMNKMGALWRKIPITHVTMLIGTIAIAGIPPFAGFFSKDEILGEAFKLNFGWVWAIGVLVAGMTAFYMWRLMGKTFYGQSHVDPAVEPKIHESTWTMTLPLVLLAIPSVLLGLVLGLPFGDSLITRWLHPVFAGAETTLGQSTEPFALFGIDGALILVSVAVATIGLVIGIALFGFFRRRGRRRTVEVITASSGATRFLYRASLNKWWFDDLNHLLFMVIGGRVANALWWFDRTVVDGTVNAVGRITVDAGGGLRRIQTGHVQNYALGIAIGLIIMAGSYLVIASR